MKLLTPASANAKTAKGKNLPYLGAILHLAPIDIAGEQSVCPWASMGCAAACLNTSGRSQISGPLEVFQDLHSVRAVDTPTLAALRAGEHPIHRARIEKTRAFFQVRLAFLQTLEKDIGALERAAQRRGIQAAVRLNGTSDIAWERINTRYPARPRAGIIEGSLMERFPAVQFYDYTKSRTRCHNYAQSRAGFPPNYHLTFSRAENTADDIVRLLTLSGVSVAVVFRHALPSEFLGARVIDGTTHDYRFLDARGVVVGLIAKGKGKADRAGFVVDCIPGQTVGGTDGG